MPPQTRTKKRTPLWDSFSWLKKNYNNSNGLPKFFVEGGYAYDMKELAEDDYRYSVDKALTSNDKAFSEWAQNVKNNNYSPLMLVITREFWKDLVHEELNERKTRKLNEALLQKDTTETFQRKRHRRMPSTCNDLLYLDGVRESVGAIIKNHAKATNIVDNKTNYFKTLAMNRIIDISDSSSGSHLDLFNAQHQKEIAESLSSKRLKQSTCDTADFDSIIEKYADVVDEHRFLRKCIKAIESENDGDKKNKKIYLQILESMIHHKYLYDAEEDNSEADYVNKLYSPMMEACFQNHEIRLRWGDTIPNACKKINYAAKIDLRITLPSKNCVDLSAVEYAKKYNDSKYYKDKLKVVLCSIIYFRDLLKKTNNYEMRIPSMIISRLEGEMLLIHLNADGWFVLEKIADVDTPPSVDLVKNGNIKNYVNTLKYFKDYCLDLKKQSLEFKSTKANSKEIKNAPSHLQKLVWFSDFACDDSSDEE